MGAVIKKESQINKVLEPRIEDMVKLVGEDNLKKETSFAIQAINSNSYLQQATDASVAKCIWNICITGLSLNPIHSYAYITPRRIGGNVEAVLTPSYKGLVKLITDTGSVNNIYAHSVYDGDFFEVELGTETSIKHQPKFKSKIITHVYAVAVLNDGKKQIEVMSIEEINEIRDKSDSYKAYAAGKTKSCIWVDFYGEMARKTVVKRLAKYVPKTNKWDRVQEAITIDNEDYQASEGQMSYIDSLLSTSLYDERQREFIEIELAGGVSHQRASKIIEDLQMNQQEPISSGANYSQTDIKNKIAKEI